MANVLEFAAEKSIVEVEATVIFEKLERFPARLARVEDAGRVDLFGRFAEQQWFVETQRRTAQGQDVAFQTNEIQSKGDKPFAALLILAHQGEQQILARDGRIDRDVRRQSARLTENALRPGFEGHGLCREQREGCLQEGIETWEVPVPLAGPTPLLVLRLPGSRPQSKWRGCTSAALACCALGMRGPGEHARQQGSSREGSSQSLRSQVRKTTPRHCTGCARLGSPCFGHSAIRSIYPAALGKAVAKKGSSKAGRPR